MKNILIIGHSNIGDVCYNMAVVRPLKDAYPGAVLSFVTSPRCRELVEGYRGIDNVIIYDRSGADKGFINQARFVMGLRKTNFDLAIALKSSARYVFLRSRSVWSVGNNKNAHIHPVDRYLALLRQNGINCPSARFDFALARKDEDFALDFFKKNNIRQGEAIAGIMPLAAWTLKSWPVERWNSLADRLKREKGLKVIALGKSDGSKFSSTVLSSLSADIIRAGQTTLEQAIALISKCNVFIGPDSSLLHIASCMGINSIGLYGPTSIDCFYPYFHRHNIVRAAKTLPCMPCCPGMNVVCNKDVIRHDFGPCMQEIRVDEVFDKIMKITERARG
ncbi:MAG: glycosyltransferase family 9 protein [Candidatus Omnitrophica bacterium]|nr:glycosyltransferase family 9 protein [Candidatus Omnitrophota bacterium]